MLYFSIESVELAAKKKITKNILLIYSIKSIYKSMKNAQKIVDQIKALLDELVGMTGEKVVSKSVGKKITATPAPKKGASGALAILTSEGFFDTPKNISTIMDKLKEIGRYYPQTTVSMNLLNLTKRRVFTRLQDKDTKNWVYVIKK